MMLYPALSKLVKIAGNRYSLVIATSKRARQIADDAEKQGIHLNYKPVKLAIDEIFEGKLLIKPVIDVDE